jgi:hypothetical protein
MGPLTTRIRKLHDDVVRGRLAKYGHWNQPVYVKEPATA